MSKVVLRERKLCDKFCICKRNRLSARKLCLDSFIYSCDSIFHFIASYYFRKKEIFYYYLHKMFELLFRVSKSLNVTSNVYFRGIKQIYF